MKIIPQKCGCVQGYQDSYIGRYGYMVKTHTGKGMPEHLEGLKRGKISGFSAGSVRRLRETLFSKSVDNSICVGSTLTVPWKVRGTCDEKTLKRFETLVATFRKSFTRHFPHSSLVYRVELQKRGAPHLHTVVWFSRFDKTELTPNDDGVMIALFCAKLQDDWVRALKCSSVSEIRKAERHAVKFDRLERDNRGALFRYLCDHASKKKQAQLGYQGRQWGVFCKDNLKSEHLEALPPFPSPHAEGVFWRMIRKLTRYRISDELREKKWKRPPPFGCVFKGGTRRRGVIFVKGGGDAVRRCYDFAILEG